MNDTNIDTPTFVNTLFPDLGEGETACIAQAIQWTNYDGKQQSSYRQYPYSEQLAATIARKPDAWYVCVSTVKSVPAGEKIRRRKADCLATWVLMLDDIGTKAEAPPIDPSAVLETSEGNYQYLYLIEPEEDGAHFEACNRAITSAGYGDAGAGGVSRVFRLPGSINHKPGKDGYATRIVEWHPRRVYDLDGIMDALGLEPEHKGTSYRELDSIEVPDDIDDAVLAWLEEKGFVYGFDEYFTSIRCPNAHLHTDGNPAAGYSPLGHGEYPLYRTFHCFHEHCQGMTGDQYLQWVAQNGGPAVEMHGVREIQAHELSKYTKELTDNERIELLRTSLPAIRKELLPDCAWTQGGNAAAAQKPTFANVQYIVNTYGIELEYNMQSRDLELFFHDERMDDLATNDAHVHRTVMDGAHRMGISGKEDPVAILNEMGARRQYHPMQRWVQDAKWDGVSRFDQLCGTLGVSDEYAPVLPLYLRRWLIQGVQACFGWKDPKQMRGVLVLAGDQNLGKTRWFESLVPAEFFQEGVQMDLRGHASKDSIAKATMTPLAELGELDTTFKMADSGALKAFLSASHDVYRAPYDRRTMKWPRATSFGASVNRPDFLVDATGSTRFWPVWCDWINADHGIDMQQMWAEVYTWWAAGEQWWLTVDEDALRNTQSDEFRSIGEAEMVAEQWFSDHDDGTVEPMNRATFCREKLNITPSNQNLSTVLAVLRRHLGKPRRQLQGVQNGWAIPTNRKTSYISALNDKTQPSGINTRFHIDSDENKE